PRRRNLIAQVGHLIESTPLRPGGRYGGGATRDPCVERADHEPMSAGLISAVGRIDDPFPPAPRDQNHSPHFLPPAVAELVVGFGDPDRLVAVKAAARIVDL